MAPFCGAKLTPCLDTFDITVSQKSFAMKLQKPKVRMKELPFVEVTPEESKALKSVLGGALWLAKETRPDLSVQVSQGQQLPTATLGDARTVCNVVRRAKQHQDLSWKILSIPLSPSTVSSYRYRICKCQETGHSSRILSQCHR